MWLDCVETIRRQASIRSKIAKGINYRQMQIRDQGNNPVPVGGNKGKRCLMRGRLDQCFPRQSPVAFIPFHGHREIANRKPARFCLPRRASFCRAFARRRQQCRLPKAVEASARRRCQKPRRFPEAARIAYPSIPIFGISPPEYRRDKRIA